MPSGQELPETELRFILQRLTRHVVRPFARLVGNLSPCASPSQPSSVFSSALRQWRRGNIALVTTLPVPDCLNLVHHLQPRRLEDRFLPQQPRKKGHSPAQSLQHIISHLPAVLRLPGSVHLLAKEIHRKMTAQSCPRKFLVFKENFRPACLDCLTEYRCTCSTTPPNPPPNILTYPCPHFFPHRARSIGNNSKNPSCSQGFAAARFLLEQIDGNTQAMDPPLFPLNKNTHCWKRQRK